MDYVEKRNPNHPIFIQAVREFVETVLPYINKNEKYQNRKLLERLVEAERIFIFRVPWVDNAG